MMPSVEIKKILNDRKKEIINGDFVNTILQTYLECGEDGVKELYRLLKNATINMQEVKDSLVKIISTFLNVE